MKVDFEFPEELIVNLENRLAQKLMQVLEDRVKMIQNKKLTRSEVAERLKISLTTVYQHTKDGLLVCENAGRRVLYDEKEVTRYLQQRQR